MRSMVGAGLCVAMAGCGSTQIVYTGGGTVTLALEPVGDAGVRASTTVEGSSVEAINAYINHDFNQGNCWTLNEVSEDPHGSHVRACSEDLAVEPVGAGLCIATIDKLSLDVGPYPNDPALLFESGDLLDDIRPEGADGPALPAPNTGEYTATFELPSACEPGTWLPHTLSVSWAFDDAVVVEHKVKNGWGFPGVGEM